MSSRLSEFFARSRIVLPVIHVQSSEQAVRNALLAKQCRCDGVFLINHGISHPALLAAFQAVRQACGDFWIGINSLGRKPETLFVDLPRDLGGVWTDNAEIDEAGGEQSAARRVSEAITRHGWQGLYFGGVAFKYQRDVQDLERAALLASQHMDVVTTSGPGTGQAADLDKVRRMKQALGHTPLALASGVTPENVEQFLPWVDAYLVATGISSSFFELDAPRVQQLVAAVHG